MTKNKERLFNTHKDEVIINYMKANSNEKFPFAKLSKLFLKEHVILKAKQIAHRWWNKLDHRLSKVRISDKEKSYIKSWVESHQKARPIIQWNELQSEMKTKFGKFHSRNDLKNVWYSYKRYLSRGNNKNNIDNSKAKLSYILNDDDIYKYPS
ncbi:10977_t:CDS:2 [Funneliformis mosseae]|uniref:10977_t:CDS:1 n=1 Tax=Funneliformis mosseae TaxID=27381 RepID=A0A9N8Z1U7_FUNMO|nr:10977_t:CDS:2 [Funneliformis mosseae]